MEWRPPPGTVVEEIYRRLLNQISGRGLGITLGQIREAGRLAQVIDEQGRRSPMTRALAEGMGLDPTRLPNVTRW